MPCRSVLFSCKWHHTFGSSWRGSRHLHAVCHGTAHGTGRFAPSLLSSCPYSRNPSCCVLLNYRSLRSRPSRCLPVCYRNLLDRFPTISRSRSFTGQQRYRSWSLSCQSSSYIPVLIRYLFSLCGSPTGSINAATTTPPSLPTDDLAHLRYQLHRPNPVRSLRESPDWLAAPLVPGRILQCREVPQKHAG